MAVLGVLPGAMLGGILLGLVETIVAGYISSGYRDAIAFAILIIVLIFKPAGLLGKEDRYKSVRGQYICGQKLLNCGHGMKSL